MAEKNGIYKCEICGNVVSVIEAADPELVCCGQPMTLLEEKTNDEGMEKHVPIIEGNKVTVGSVPHPMEEDHWIELIQALKDGEVVAEKRLKAGEEPVVEFNVEFNSARVLCNIHGLWKS